MTAPTVYGRPVVSPRTCRSCAFWVCPDPDAEPTDGIVLGLCHRHPPSEPPVEQKYGSRHVRTHREDWCGEWGAR